MSAVRHRFESEDPMKRFSEQLRFYGKLRGTEYHRAFPLPKTLVSDLRQLTKPWTAAAIDAVTVFMGGTARAWLDIFAAWQKAAERVVDSKLAPTDVYDDNAGFWMALGRLAIQLDAKDMIVTSDAVLVWAVKETVREHVETVKEVAETVKDHAEAVYDAGKEAVGAVTDVFGAIPTIAKALAVGAVGLGVYAIARK